MPTPFQYIRDLESYREALAYLKPFPALAGDTETYVLPRYIEQGFTDARDCHTSEISILILKPPKGSAVLFDIIVLKELGADFEPLRELVEAKEYILFHNSKFDLKMFRSTFGWMPENTRCTMIMAKLITNATGSKVGRMTGHSYADLCRDLFSVSISGKGEEQISSWYLPSGSRTLDNPYWAKKLEYAANDVKYLFAIESILYPYLTNPRPQSPLYPEGVQEGWGLGLKAVVDIEMEYIVSAAEIEYAGIGVSAPTISYYQRAVKAYKDKLAVDLCRKLNLEEPEPNLLGKLAPSRKVESLLNSSGKLLTLIRTACKVENLDNVQTKVLERMCTLIELLFSARKEIGEEDAVDEDSLFVSETEHRLYGELVHLEESVLVEATPIIRTIVAYKKALKQEGMDVSRFIHPITGRIHYNLSTIGAATGRSACSGPNLQQCSNKLPLTVTIPADKLWHSDSMEILP